MASRAAVCDGNIALAVTIGATTLAR